MPPENPDHETASGHKDAMVRPSWYERFKDACLRELSWFDAFLNRWLKRSLFLGMHLFFLVAACYAIILGVAHGRAYDRLDDVPPRVCGLVLGCVKKVGDRDNLFFGRRMEAAADLYKNGKVQFLLVSGDNSREGQNEPADMKEALITLGVPANRIYCDYAGFRTIDSIIRARKVFGQVEFTIVSQEFHNERALYIARRKGLDGCIAYNATDANLGSMLRLYIREAGARVMAILDVEVLKTEPKFLGEKISIGEKSPPVDAPR